MLFLLDTNAVISLLDDAGSKLSHELYYGAFKSKRIERNVALVDSLQFKVVDFGLWLWLARRSAHRRGR